MQRNLKIKRTFQKRIRNKNIEIPQINLCGKWLQNAGFKINSFVSVQIENNKLIISMV